MKKMNVRRVLLAWLVIPAILLSACANVKPEPRDAQGRLTVVTSLFPVYDFVRQIGGSHVSATLLLPPGVEPHGYEPSPKDIRAIGKSGLFIYTLKSMEPWVDKVVSSSRRSGPVVEAGAGIELMDMNEEMHEAGHDDHDEESADGKDPHIWLDPVNAQAMVKNIEKALSAADADHTADYHAGAEKLLAELGALDTDFASALKKTDSKTLVFGGHFVFGYFAKRYGLTFVTPYRSFSPDAEPTPKSIAELADTLKKAGNKTVYYEELIDPKVAKVLADSTGAQMLLLHGVHNLSKEEMNSGVTYVQLMRQNLENLKKGLGYHG